MTRSNALLFRPGDKADAARWDSTWPPRSPQRMGICTVIEVEAWPQTESGWVITVESTQGRQQRLDQNWLRHAPKP